MLAFENWWDEQIKRETKGPTSTTSSSSTVGPVLAQPAQSATQSSEQQPAAAAKKVGLGFEGLNFGFGLGLGLRAAMPKLPSFRVSESHNCGDRFGCKVTLCLAEEDTAPFASTHG